MRIDAFVLVLLIYMTLLAGDLLRRVDYEVIHQHTPQNLVILRDVAISALEIQPAHMNVYILIREVKTLIQVTMLYSVAAAAVKVAFAAILAGGCTDALCGSQEVHPFSRIAKFPLAICPGIGMAGQTINIFLFG